MTIYRIISPFFTATVTESGDAVTEASDALSWTVGQSWESVRRRCNNMGWELEPMLERHKPNWLGYHGVFFELTWHGDTLSRITKHEDGEATDISFSELPETLQNHI
jgi:hypothetical protein